MKAGVIINPKSAGAGKKGKALAKTLGGMPDIATVLLDDFTALPEILADFAAREIGLIAVSGGDGTVQGVQTVLAENKIDDMLPRLAVLPHGTTNLWAAVVGLKRC